MPIRAKSIYEPASPQDGTRVLTTNYWPRGISRERAGIYRRILGPARDLLHAFKQDQINWETYRIQYLEQMRGHAAQEEIARLADLASTGTVTVMCVCRDEHQCHRSLLRDLIDQRMRSAV